MSGATVVPFLALITIGAVILAAWISQERTIRRMKDPEAPKSKLAEDEPTPVKNPTIGSAGDDASDGEREAA